MSLYKTKHPILTLTLSAAILALPVLVQAAHEKLPDRFVARVGVYNVRDADTTLRVDEREGIEGTTLNFRRDLGVSESDDAPRVDGYYRFTPRHRIDFSWFKVEREGTRTIDIDMEFEDEIFTIGTQVDSFSKYETLKIAYIYSFHHDEKFELGVGGGLHIEDIEIGLNAAGVGKREDANTTAPAPVASFRLGYNFTPRWSIRWDFDIFFLDEDDFDGSLTDSRLAVEHHTFKNVGFGAGFSRFVLDIEIEDDDLIGTVDIIRDGWLFYTTAYF